MASYSQEFKDQIVRKLMPPTVMSVAALSRETGIPSSTYDAFSPFLLLIHLISISQFAARYQHVPVDRKNHMKKHFPP